MGTWLQFGGRPPDCTGCGYFQETQRHCLWDCPLAQQIWGRLLRLVRSEWFTWGSVAWSTLSGPALGYEALEDGVALQYRHQSLERAPAPDFSSSPSTEDRYLRWELISSLGLWFVWRARCRRIFEGRTVSPVETLWDFRVQLVHSLMGQLERLQGDSDSMTRRREAFL